jgi:hypothetical protein
MVYHHDVSYGIQSNLTRMTNLNMRDNSTVSTPPFDFFVVKQVRFRNVPGEP